MGNPTKICKKCKERKPRSCFRWFAKENYRRGSCEDCIKKQKRALIVKYSPEQEVEIIRLYKKGYGAPEIARMTGCSSKCKVSTFIKQHGLSRTIAQIRSDNAKQFIGKKFGKLTILERLVKKGKVSWKCQCDCGNVAVVPYGNLFSNDTRSCGCLRKRKRNESPTWKGYEEISGNFYRRTKDGATKRELLFDVNIEYIWDLFLKQKRLCTLSGVLLRFPSLSNSTDGTASLDRIDSSKGYVEGNVQWVHKWINVMKSNFKTNDFLTIIKCIYSHNNLDDFIAGNTLDSLATLNR